MIKRRSHELLLSKTFLQSINSKFDYQYSLNTPEDLETMVRLGFNSVRLGVIWEAVEKAPGVYDYDYLGNSKTIKSNER